MQEAVVTYFPQACTRILAGAASRNTSWQGPGAAGRRRRFMD
jgi:hypothetical protein